MRTARPLANGLTTQHPVPGLAFVDDSPLPADDVRLKNTALRTGDFRSQPDGRWSAYLPDAARPELAWCIRHNPEHGRSVLLFPARCAAAVLNGWRDRAVLDRAGGYWWDGTAWYRPGQTWDPASADYQPRLVPDATTITAADLCATRDRPPTAADELSLAPRWRDELSRWAARHTETSDRPLDACVITLRAPELQASRLLAVPAMAATAGISASTLRAYISRGLCDVPAPQAVAHRRRLWARPVAQEWAEQRRTRIGGPLNDTGTSALSPGAADARHQFARVFLDTLWSNPQVRKRWTLHHRTEAEVRQVADELGHKVATRLDDILPFDVLAPTLTAAFLHTLTGPARTGRGDRATPIAPALTAMLFWLNRHHPDLALQVIRDTAEAARRRGIAPAHTEQILLRLLNERENETPAG